MRALSPLEKGDARAREEFRSGVRVLRELSLILGLFHEPVSEKADESLAEQLRKLVADLGGAPPDGVENLMRQLIQMRADARKAKNFGVADQIRKRIGELKVTLEDRPGGKTDWRVG